MLYTQMENFAEAELFYSRSIRISEHTLGSDHPQTTNALMNLAYRYLDNGKTDKAADLASRVNLADVLSFTSEQQRLVFQLTVNPYSLPARLNMSQVLAQTILRRKGVVLDSLLEDRLISQASEKPEQREIIAELLIARQRLMQVSLEAPKYPVEDARERRDTEKKRISNRVEREDSRSQLGTIDNKCRVSALDGNARLAKPFAVSTSRNRGRSNWIAKAHREGESKGHGVSWIRCH
jgi:hypothetical protein